MKCALRFSHVFLVVLLLPFVLQTLAYANGDVTFQVNMSIQMRENKFLPGAGDTVYARGDFTGWATTTPLTDGNNDSIYTVTVTNFGDTTIHYKFFKTLRGGLDWEHNQPTVSTNREYTVVDGAQSISTVWFNDDSVYVAPVNVGVTFQVNMRVKMLDGAFRPDLGDVVTAQGDFNGWANSLSGPWVLTDPNGDSIYTNPVPDTVSEGSTIHYKFYKTARAGGDWEHNQSTPSTNREFIVPTGGGPIPAVYFDNDSIPVPSVNANILFQVNMNPYEDIGIFRPDLGDSVEIRGGFNGWAGGPAAIMTEDPFNPGVYQITAPYTASPNSIIDYKFRMKFDSAQGTARFPGYGTNAGSDWDNVSYDHPFERGDGNRQLDIGSGGNITVPVVDFSSVGACGEIPAGDSVTVTAQINMGPATRALIVFNPATDTLWLTYEDHLGRDLQVKYQGANFPANGNIYLSRTADTIFTATWTIVGPAHYALMYSYHYKQVGGGQSDETGGLGGQNLHRARFIARANNLHCVRNYTMPLEKWQGTSPPYPDETPSCGSETFAMCNGWNMVSVPKFADDYHKSVLFPNASGSLFAYNNGYLPVDPLSNGPGFWVNYNGAQNNSMFGAGLYSLDIPVSNGWNMIGSVSTSVPVGTITSTNPGIVISPYFGYNCGTGYVVASSIDPGFGYWVRVNAGGTLHLTAGLPAANKQVAAINDVSKFNTLTIQDQAGHKQVLYFSAAGTVDASRFEMPPRAPEGAFDVRFASNQMLAVVENNHSDEFPISISTASNTVKVSWTLYSSDVTGSLVSGTKVVKMVKNGSVTMSSSDLKLVLNGTKNDAMLPKTYALQQNYPNPFNPTTSILYQLPFDSKVTVKIYDIMGNEVKTLVDNDQDAGYKTLQWNSTNNTGTVVSSGVYFYRITATNLTDHSKIFVDTKKMMLLK